jgi:hypothetical protein
MAITIQSSPAPYSSMHDDLWYVSSSNLVNAAGVTAFKFVYDVYVNGAQVSRTKVYPSPSAEGSYGVFNASPMVRAFVTNYFEPSGSSILVASNDKIKVNSTIQVGEEYASGGGNLVTYTNLASGALSSYNYYPPLFADILFVNSNTPLVLSDYYDNLLLENFTDDWITERDLDNITIEYGDNFYATYFKVTAGSYQAWIDVINESGTVIDTASGGITFTGEMNLFNCQAGHINTFAGRTLITENTYGYNVYLKRGVAISRKLQFKQKCYPKYRQYNLHFLNRLGGWDTMKFALVNKRSTSVERAAYRRNDWQLTGNTMSNIDSYNKYNETTLNYAIQHKDMFHLVSDWVSQQDYEWLAQLFASTITYMEVQGAYFPVTISSTNYEYKLESSDKLFNFEIDIEVGKYITSQFR